MANWCENEVLIRGKVEDIQRYKDSLLKDMTGKYYPFFSTVSLPELKDKAEVDEYLARELDNETLFGFHYRTIDLEVIENNPEELKLKFDTAYSPAINLCIDELFPKLSILHRYFEPMMAYHGFYHYVKGKLIASGDEQCETQESPWQMYDYSPWPAGVNPLEEKLKRYYIIPLDQLRPMDELPEYLNKEVH